LGEVGDKTLDIFPRRQNVGLKTAAERDAQADFPRKIWAVCEDKGTAANLQNDTYEVENVMCDFKGSLTRIADFKLGPDLNGLVLAGGAPVAFINT